MTKVFDIEEKRKINEKISMLLSSNVHVTLSMNSEGNVEIIMGDELDITSMSTFKSFLEYMCLNEIQWLFGGE